MREVKRILAATDFDDDGDAAVDYACHLAQQLGAELHLLHVVPKSFLPIRAAEEEQRLQSAHEGLGRLPERITPANLMIVRKTCEGAPADEILRYAEEIGIDLIVLGTHGRSGLAHFVLGSIAEKLIRAAACPIVIIRGSMHQLRDDTVAGDESSSTGVPAFRSLGQVAASNRVLELLERALAVRATDVHIDPISSDEFKVRFRVDGRLEQYCILDRSVALPLLMQLKVMSDLDIARPFEPNEGRVGLPASMADTEVRITTIPVAGGDAVALRLLRHEATPPSLSELGFSPQAMAAVNGMLHDGEGIVLVTGPTGSGKTTTVHAMLRLLDNGTRNLMSIEDPVEYRVPAIRQMSVDAKHGLTMTRGLRTLLRMDPDVVFIGEIRDVEAMEIALRAASSGKYVFSTLHTRDVASTVTALRDLNADNLSLGGNLKGIVSQRLMRRVCRECCGRSEPSEPERNSFLAEGVEPPQMLPRPNGCPNCRNTGFRGRIGVFEAVRTTGNIAEAIQRGTAEDELRRTIRSAGTTSLMADALTRVRDGVTSLEEALSIKWA
jgi:type II secretory ATPase GspE/PulE/Tfp pilus assembly ATPase PilB-like protein/nucleotide-binding universal stress UspA family protein